MRNGEGRTRNLRSQLWFDDPHDPGMTALYLERYLNYGLTRKELQSGRPIIGIAQTGNDLAPCNRHHLDLAERVTDGIRDAGGVGFEFPVSEHRTPGQELYRSTVGQHATGACIELATRYVDIIARHGNPRHSH